MDKSEQTGNAAFDRGKITDKRKREHWQYKVESYTRKGVRSRWMESVGAYLYEWGECGKCDTSLCTYYPDGKKDKFEYEIGDEVYFFMFADGRGMILGKMCRDT